MKKYGKLTPAQTDSLQDLPIVIRYTKITHHSGIASYFREHLRGEVLKWVKQYNEQNETKINLYTDGLKIHTTIDSRLQRHAEEAMKRQMAETQKRFAQHWRGTDPWQSHKGMLDEVIRKSERYKNLLSKGLAHAEILEAMNKPVLMNVFTWEGEKEVTMSAIDSIKHYLKFLNAGVLAIDPAQGAIRVWVGGINHHYFQYDHVRESTKRQVGSTFKPIVYAAALEQGVDPCDYISAERITYSDMENWSPENSDGTYDVKYSLTGALVNSVNTVSVQVLEKAGIPNTIQLARRMGISSPITPVPSIALGTPSISMMEMVSAYACFVNRGKAIEPYYITSITTHDNVVLENFESPKSHQALSAESAAIMLHMLRRAVDEGTGSSLRTRFGLTNDIAGKTGTTQSNTDGWFIAMTPALVIGAWVGADDPRIRFRSTALGQGAATALPIVGDFLQRSNRDKALSSVMYARFPELSPALERKLDCDLTKSDDSFFKDLFRKKDQDKTKEFGKKEKGFFKKLFGRK
jgi:penicillin-binding protein 1A